MKILVLGGTGFFGIHMVRNLLQKGHHVTVATRGRAKDGFGDSVDRIAIERTDQKSMSDALGGMRFDVVCDSLALSSNDVKYLLDVIKTDRYVMTSSGSVYDDKLLLNTEESDFDPLVHELKWCSRKDFSYTEIKRQAECALFQVYQSVNSVAVRLPYVTGGDDYTKRLYFYVEHIIRDIPMHIDNLDSEIAFIHSTDAGAFLSWLAEQSHTGAVNGSGEGTVSMREVIRYVEQKTGKHAIITPSGEAAPYNSDVSFSLSTRKAESWGYKFKHIDDWLHPTLDEYIASIH